VNPAIFALVARGSAGVNATGYNSETEKMENRIDRCFADLRLKKRKGFIPYICAGDPDLKVTVDLSLALANAGADILELGVPFSDPLADGIVNQLAAQRALSAGATVRGVLDSVRRIRAGSQVPIVLYTYFNPIMQFGLNEFHREAAAAGVDGLLILDLPPEEEGEASAGNLLHIRLIAPTTSPQRIAEITRNAQGFLYYVSREGVTGAREDVSASLADNLKQIRKLSDLPIAVGFGISNPQQAREVARHADAVVVGSAIVKMIEKAGRKSVEEVRAFAREIVDAIN
jgi:tryptophan synthase alpha chain